MSKLLDALNAQIAQATDAATRGELRARKAGYLARIGSFEEARQLIASLRQEFANGSSPATSIWIMLAEGLLHTFQEMSDEGADRIMRAHALARMTRDRNLISTSSAWHAFTQSERSEFKGMARSLEEALTNADSGDHEVLARIYMILANARMSVGDADEAYDLYMLSRHHALECGDQATIDALIYNMAAFALGWERARLCFGESNPEHLRRFRSELASAKTYQQLAGVSALSNFVYLWEARLLLLSGEMDAAIAALRSVRSMHPFARYNYHESLIDLEIAYCLARQNKLTEADVQGGAVLDADLSSLHDDDKLFAAWARLAILQSMPSLGSAKAAEESLATAREEFVSECEEIRKALGEVGSHPHIIRPKVVSARIPL